VAKERALKGVHPGESRKVYFAGCAGGMDDVFWVEDTRLTGAVGEGANDADGPLLGGVVPSARLDFGLHPDIELKEFSVPFKPICQLVLGGEDGPKVWEGEVRQVVVPHGVVEDELSVPLAPVVADGVVGVDDEGGDVEHLESSVGRQTALAGANNQDRWFGVGEVDAVLAPFSPAFASGVVAVLNAPGSVVTQGLLVTGEGL
jgi:hypothetical protein